MKINSFLNRLNVTKHVTDHICNEHYTKLHRRIAGGILVFSGVIISKLGGDYAVLHVVFDAFGYGLHGIGLIPFITELEGSK